MNSLLTAGGLICLAALIVGGSLIWRESGAQKAPNSEFQLPKELQTTTFGALHLEEVKFPGFYAFSYVGTWQHPQRGAIRVVFHPPKTDPNSWHTSVSEAEARAIVLMAREREILQSGGDKFGLLFRDYQIDERTIDAVYSDLKLSMLKLASAGDDELVYAPCKWFPTFDLFVSVSSDRGVTRVNFDG